MNKNSFTLQIVFVAVFFVLGFSTIRAQFNYGNNASNNKTLNVRAGNNITLQSGFSVELNGQFTADTENVSDCGSSTVVFANREQ
jgi:preprotein translocase subunit YajC